jgi:hypothetical protein
MSIVPSSSSDSEPLADLRERARSAAVSRLPQPGYLEQAHDWIAARIPPRPADEPEEDAALPHCAGCSGAIYHTPGARGEKTPGAFGFDWHDFCFETHPFPGRTRY